MIMNPSEGPDEYPVKQKVELLFNPHLSYYAPPHLTTQKDLVCTQTTFYSEKEFDHCLVFFLLACYPHEQDENGWIQMAIICCDGFVSVVVLAGFKLHSHSIVLADVHNISQR